jgi:hypothetical protein
MATRSSSDIVTESVAQLGQWHQDRLFKMAANQSIAEVVEQTIETPSA